MNSLIVVRMSVEQYNQFSDLAADANITLGSINLADPSQTGVHDVV